MQRLRSNENKSGKSCWVFLSFFWQRSKTKINSFVVKVLHVRYASHVFSTCRVVITLISLNKNNLSMILIRGNLANTFLSFYITDCFSFTVMTSSGTRSWTWSLTGVRCVQLGGGTKHGPLSGLDFSTPSLSPSRPFSGPLSRPLSRALSGLGPLSWPPLFFLSFNWCEYLSHAFDNDVITGKFVETSCNVFYRLLTI